MFKGAFSKKLFFLKCDLSLKFAFNSVLPITLWAVEDIFGHMGELDL